LFSTAVIKAIRRSFPDCFLASLLPPRCREILEDNPNLNEVILFDEKRARFGFISIIPFIFLLRKKRFDTCILLHRSMTRTLIAYLAGIPRRIGFSYRKRNFLLTDIIEIPDMNRTHRVDYYLKLAEAIGADTQGEVPQFYFRENDRSYVRHLLERAGVKSGDFCVVINPGGNWEPKRWPKENFSLLCDRLISDLSVKVIIVGAGKDKGLVEDIVMSMKTRPINLAGKINLKQLGALFTITNLVISADTAPLHIANSQGARVICLFGPTSPEVTGPYPKNNQRILQKDVGCKIPCYNLHCTDNRCMKALSVEDVLKAVREVVKK